MADVILYVSMAWQMVRRSIFCRKFGRHGQRV